MPRKKKPDPQYHAHVWRSGKRLCFLSDAPQAGSGLTHVAAIDIGRPFRHHVPSDGRGPSGLVIDGMTGVNAEPWQPSQVLAAARHRMFGFKLLEAS